MPFRLASLALLVACLVGVDPRMVRAGGA